MIDKVRAQNKGRPFWNNGPSVGSSKAGASAAKCASITWNDTSSPRCYFTIMLTCCIASHDTWNQTTVECSRAEFEASHASLEACVFQSRCRQPMQEPTSGQLVLCDYATSKITPCFMRQGCCQDLERKTGYGAPVTMIRS